MSVPVTSLIPHRPPFLFVDEIVSETADTLVAKRTFRADEDFYRRLGQALERARRRTTVRRKLKKLLAGVRRANAQKGSIAQ